MIIAPPILNRPHRPIQGLSLHGMTVECSSPDKLIVHGTTRLSLFAIVAGIFLIGIGIMYWSEVLERRDTGPRNHASQPVNVKTLSFPLLGMFAVGYGIN